MINNSLAAADPRAPLLRARAAAELPLIDKVKTELAERTALIPMLAAEPGAIPDLQALGATQATTAR